MKRINILTKTVYNRIAAGEVVERPYSVVKELVENSLDSGATDIEIYIEKGGKQLVRVADNGMGIFKDDLPAAFMPHATSKISCVDDLEHIKTLGFRGEALASISAISKTEIISVTVGNPAYSIKCDGGVVGEVVPAALEKGTVISVYDLFFNTPVRAKFLKADKKEETDITNFVSRFILANPEVRFKYYADGKIVLQSFGGGLEEAIAQVYGAKVIPQCIKIDALKDGIRLHGFIGNQNFFKPNKSYQSIFLNGRYIVNYTIATAISNAYSSYAMKRQFPFYILNVEVPNDIVDVNVHPNKADVRFIDNNLIFGVVYKVISSVLDGAAAAAEFVVGGGRVPEIKSTIGDKSDANKVYTENKASEELIEKYMPAKSTGFPEDRIKKPDKEESATESDEASDYSERKYFNPETDLPLNEFYGAENQLKKLHKLELDGDTSGVSDASLSTDNPYRIQEQEIEKRYFERKQARIDYDTCTYCGSVFNTYLIYEYQDKIYLIDQHAAHERLIYDRYIKNVRDRGIIRQPLLIPYVFDVNVAEAHFLDKSMKKLADLGFVVTSFGGNVYRVDEIPSDLCDISLEDFFDDILADIDSLNEIRLEDIFKDKIATAACKHAIKGGMKLTQQEVDTLMKMLEGNMGLKCPHGRPVCVTMTKRDIEKMFKRIV